MVCVGLGGVRGSVRVCVGLRQFVWVYVGPRGSVWVRVGLCGSAWVCVGLCGSAWVHVVCVGLCGCACFCVGMCGSAWVPVVPCGSVRSDLGEWRCLCMGHQLEACSFSSRQMADRREDVWPFYHQGSGVCV